MCAGKGEGGREGGREERDGRTERERERETYGEREREREREREIRHAAAPAIPRLGWAVNNDCEGHDVSLLEHRRWVRLVTPPKCHLIAPRLSPRPVLSPVGSGSRPILSEFPRFSV